MLCTFASFFSHDTGALTTTRRAGYTEGKARRAFVLPSSVESLQDRFKVTENVVSQPTFDFAWSDVVEDSREKKLLSQSFSLRYEESLSYQDIQNEVNSVTESVVKVRKSSIAGNVDLTVGRWCLAVPRSRTHQKLGLKF